MKEYQVDLTSVFNADEFHERLGEVVPLPSHYGKNLDALHDVLTESKDWKLTFSSTTEAEVTMGKYMASLRRMCKEPVGNKTCTEAQKHQASQSFQSASFE